MAKSTAKKKRNKNRGRNKLVGRNRRARFDYKIVEEIECGIMLAGSEVKSLRSGEANIAESYATVENAELWLVNCYIASYENTSSFKHEERRQRKMLVNKRELAKLWSATRRQGMTLVALELYFNHKGIAKLKIGLAKGKRLPDKRHDEKKRDWERDKARQLRDN